MKIVELKNKITDLEDFFKCAAGELMKQTRFKRLHFLVPDDKNGDFVTKHSTHGAKIRLTKKELRLLGENIEKDIFYPKKVFQRNGFLGKISFIKINWKIRLHGISAIMPIYSDGKIICLILFTGQLVDDWLNRNSHYIDRIRQEMTHCLETILLYNQTLERIIKEYDLPNKRLVCHAIQIPDEQVPVLIGKKIKFL